jgi:hypothetical protein
MAKLRIGFFMAIMTKENDPGFKPVSAQDLIEEARKAREAAAVK